MCQLGNYQLRSLNGFSYIPFVSYKLLIDHMVNYSLCLIKLLSLIEDTLHLYSCVVIFMKKTIKKTRHSKLKFVFCVCSFTQLNLSCLNWCLFFSWRFKYINASIKSYEEFDRRLSSFVSLPDQQTCTTTTCHKYYITSRKTKWLSQGIQ